MANWEFFLQTIGEENWFRLNSSQPDIPSGRYCLFARAPHHAHELIEVEVKTRQNRETLTRTPKFQHFCQLDENGFGMLVEEIQLKPGFWEIECRRELSQALTEPDWEIKLAPRVTLHLEKAAIQLKAEKTGELAATSQEESLESLRSRVLNHTDQMLEEVIEEVFSDFPSHLLPKGNSEQTQYSINLDQESFTAPLNKPIIISGKISSHSPSPPAELHLDIVLRDPRTGEIVTKLSPPIFPSSFPFPFCYSVTLAKPCNTYLLQGEITLTDTSEKNSPQVLAEQTFSVTATWEKLESLIASTITSPTIFHPPAPLSPLPEKTSSFTKKKWQGVLPPRLVSKKENKKTISPTLPNLPNTIVKDKKPKPKKEYVWSKPNNQAEQEHETLEWEIIPELVITSEDTET